MFHTLFIYKIEFLIDSSYKNRGILLNSFGESSRQTRRHASVETPSAITHVPLFLAIMLRLLQVLTEDSDRQIGD